MVANYEARFSRGFAILVDTLTVFAKILTNTPEEYTLTYPFGLELHSVGTTWKTELLCICKC
jgi:hypothetical protein